MHGLELTSIHVEAGSRPVQHDVVDARQRLEPVERLRGLHRHRRPRQVAELGEAPRLDRAAEPDDRDAIAERLDLGQDVAGEKHRAARAAAPG